MHRHSGVSLTFGILLIIIGSLLLIGKFADFHLSRSIVLPGVFLLVGLLCLSTIRGRERAGGAFPGTFFVLAGALMLSMNYSPIYDALSRIYPWSYVLMFLGISFLVPFIIKPRDWGVLAPAGVLLGLGALSALRDLDMLGGIEFDRLWPLIPLAVGLGIVLHAILKKPQQTT